MNVISILKSQWSHLRVAYKFGFGFALLLLLLFGIATSSYISQRLVQQQTEAAVVASVQIQRLVLQMDAGLARARQLQRDFILNYPTMGYEAARDEFAQVAIAEMEQVVRLSRQLRTIIAESALNDPLRESDVNVNLYLASAERFIDTFEVFVENVAVRADPPIGVIPQLEQLLDETAQLLNRTENEQLPSHFLQVETAYRDYLATGRTSLMQESFNKMYGLSEIGQTAFGLTDTQRRELQQKSELYEELGQYLLEIDTELARNLRDFELQATTVDPIGDDLIELAEAELVTAQQQISQINQLATGMLGVSTVLGGLVAFVVVGLLNNSITKQIVSLTIATRQFDQGNFQAQATVWSKDEIGLLAQTFNQMTNRLTETLGQLEELLAEREATIVKLAARTEQLETVAALGERFNALLSVDQIMNELVSQIKAKFDYFYVHVYLLDEQEQNLVLVAAYGEVGRQLIAQGHQIALSSPKSLVARAARTHQVIQVQDVYTIDDWLPNELLPNTRSEISVPILYEDAIIGVLDAQENEVAGLDEGDANLLRSLASQIGVAVKNAQLLAERQTTIGELQKVDEAKSQFITMMSHELRTPLNAINGFAEMMAMGMSGDLPDQAQAEIELIHKNGLHLTHLVNDILDISQIEAGDVHLEPIELVINEIVSELIAEVAPLKQGKPVELKNDIPTDFPLIYADRTRVRQILFNLLNNAIKFTSQGDVTVLAQRYSEQFVWLAVRDTGIGIPSKDTTRVFGSFQQVDMSDARQYGGTGLGLAICQQLVELHGGEIGVNTREGQGSEFWFTMPLA